MTDTITDLLERTDELLTRVDQLLLGQVLVAQLSYDATTADADPGAGEFRFNNAAVASATKIWLDNVDSSGASIAAWVDTFDDSTSAIRGFLVLRGVVTPTAFAIFAVTGAVVDKTGYRELTIAHVASGGTWTAGEGFAPVFARNGDKGDTGATGAGYAATSATSIALASSGSKAFTTQAGLAYLVGSRVRAASAANPTTKFMEGVVTAYSGTTLTITADYFVGSGSVNDWNISVTGEGAPGAAAAAASATAAAASATTAAGHAATTTAAVATTADNVTSCASSAAAALVSELAAAASASGFTPKAARVASTANLTLSGAQTIDGVSAIAGDVVLVKDQSSPAQNGLYTVAAGAWARTAAMDTWAEVISAFVVVAEGAANADSIWLCTNNAGGTIGSTAISFTKYLGPGMFAPASTALTNYAADPLSTEELASVSGPFGKLAFSNGANRLLNGAFAINQRNLTTAADDAYCLDRWYVLTETGSVTLGALTDPETGRPTGIRLTQPDSSAKRIGLAQIVESGNARDLRSKAAAMAARLRCSSSQPIRMAILEWTGTADSVTSDVVNNWSSTTYTPGNFFIAGVNVIATGASTPTANAWTDMAQITGSFGASMNNAIVMVWTAGTLAQNATLDLDQVQLEEGAACGAFARRSLGEELALCQRYCFVVETTGQYQYLAPAYCNTPGYARIMFTFPRRMRSVPSLTVDQPTKISLDTAGVVAITALNGINLATPWGASADFTTVSGPAAGAGGVAYSSGGISAPFPKVTWDAEL